MKKNKQIIIGNLMGGLGNQMFQFAFYSAMAKARKLPLKFCSEYFKHTKIHQGLELHKVFNIKLNFATNKDIKNSLHYVKNGGPIVFDLLYSFYKDKHITNPKFIIFNKTQNIFLSGYWQNLDYFDNFSEELRQIFRFKKKLDDVNHKLISEINSSLSVAVHIRRGDYLSFKNYLFHGTCKPQYYEEAMRKLLLVYPNAIFYIFSDDSESAKDMIHKDFIKKCKIIDHNKQDRSYIDMQLMSSCKHHIIANSSFSWWAAWLSNNPKKMVFVPKRWFRFKLTSNLNLIPSEWTII